MLVQKIHVDRAATGQEIVRRKNVYKVREKSENFIESWRIGIKEISGEIKII